MFASIRALAGRATEAVSKLLSPAQASALVPVKASSVQQQSGRALNAADYGPYGKPDKQWWIP